LSTASVKGASSRENAFGHVTAAQQGRGLPTLLRIARMNLRHPWQIALTLVATAVAASLQLAIPKLLGRAVDQAQGIAASGNDLAAAAAESALWGTALMLLTVSILRGLFTLVQNYFGESVGHHLAYELRLACYEKLQRLSFSFHDRVHSGDLIMLGIIDIDGVRMLFSTGLVRVLLLGTLIGVGAYMLLSTNLELGLMALCFVPFAGWRSTVMQLTLRKTWMELQERMQVLSRVMDENLGGTRVVRAFAAQEFELAKFDAAQREAMALTARRIKLRVGNTAMMNFSFYIAMGLVLMVGGFKVSSGEISVGTLASFLSFMTILQMPVRQLGQMVNSFARASTCGQRLFELLDLDVEIRDKPGARPIAVTEGTIRFEHVDFRYPGMDHNVLTDVSLTAHKGETIGIVGPPGSGKSTLAHLIPRFYDVTGGSISIDGQDIRSVSLKSLRQAVAVVQQDSFLFTTTIENNIVYGDPWAKERRIERAADSAQLHNYITGLPTGYKTVVGERGVSLSGGQRQRLSIARTLILKPAVMVFDDSTAAIDAATEQRIRSAMRRFAKDRVTLIIAHRLSSLMHADRILFLEEGRVVEQGTHEELLELGGRYRALYDLQVRPEEDLKSGEAA
jgi:ATP-binding cassette subfamily B protein